MLNVGGVNFNNVFYFVFYVYGVTKILFRIYLVVIFLFFWVKGIGLGILFIICVILIIWRKVILFKEDGGIFLWYIVVASYKIIYFVIVDFFLVKSGKFWILYFDKFVM